MSGEKKIVKISKQELPLFETDIVNFLRSQPRYTLSLDGKVMGVCDWAQQKGFDLTEIDDLTGMMSKLKL